MIKTILWDIDGTLLNFEEAEKYAIRTCFEQFGLGVCTDEMLADYSVINRSYWQTAGEGEAEYWMGSEVPELLPFATS